jgi:drug/metabolite transporter (DMT)-like permease
VAALPQQDRSAHRRAVLLMIATTTLWSVAGVVTRRLSPSLLADGRFEIAFWRALFAAVFVGAYLFAARREGLRPLRQAGGAGLVSGLMWAIMFTTFMVALTLTTVANTLIVMSVGPLITAMLARAVLRTPVPARTWAAIAAATAGIVWMFAGGAVQGPGRALGMAIAFSIPLAQAVNLVTLQKSHAHVDLVPAVLLGGAIAALVMLPLALPFRADVRDIALLAGLGFFQLGLPCMLMVVAARRLAAPEVALLGLLEVVLGPIWAWIGAGEAPETPTLVGGALVLSALALNEAAALLAQRWRARA